MTDDDHGDGYSEDHVANLDDEIARLEKRCRRLEYALRYWIPDETMVEPEHKIAWDEHIALLTD